MKIKKEGFTTFKLNFDNISVLTDPDIEIKEFNPKAKFDSDIVVFSNKSILGEEDYIATSGLNQNIKNDHRENIFEIVNYGEYEIGEVFIRHLTKSGVYVLDEGYLRLVYCGLISEDFDTSLLKEIGDVDILILPVGDAGIFPNYQKTEKIINQLDPQILIPSAYKVTSVNGKYESVKPVDDFLKDLGFSNTRREKELKVTSTPVQEDKAIEVVILD